MKSVSRSIPGTDSYSKGNFHEMVSRPEISRKVSVGSNNGSFLKFEYEKFKIFCQELVTYFCSSDRAASNFACFRNNVPLKDQSAGLIANSN